MSLWSSEKLCEVISIGIGPFEVVVDEWWEEFNDLWSIGSTELTLSFNEFDDWVELFLGDRFVVIYSFLICLTMLIILSPSFDK